MASLAHARFDDQPRPSQPVEGALHLLARAANDNAPYANLTSTTEGAAAVGSNPALNLTTTFTPDGWGNVTATSDPLSHTSNQTFDLDRRVLLAIAPDPGTGARPATNTTYDANGRAVEVDKGTTNAAGTTFTAAETTDTAFDPNGNKTQVSVLNGTAGSAALSVTQINYDGLNRVNCTVARENSAAFTSLPDACTQSAGGPYGPDPITRIAYDLAGQELTETRGWGTPLAQAYTTFTWGQDGEKLSVMDANTNAIQLGYDGFNRLNAITHPDSTTETSVYDPDGDLVIWTNRGGYGVVRCYDVLNRKISETGITGATLSGACATGGTSNITTRPWDIQLREFTYDLAGRLTAADIPYFALEYDYDAAGRPANMYGARTATYGWDNAGNLHALTYPDTTTVVDYQYDPLNRTTQALIGTGNYGTLSYDTLGRRQTLTFQDTSTQTWHYDNADRVTSIVHVFPNRTTDNVTYTYTYDPSGRDASRVVNNSVYRHHPTAASTTYATANALNQYPSVGGYTYSYWQEGELNETDTLQTNYNEFGKLMLAYITTTPGTIDPNNFDFMGVDALDHVYYHGRQTVATENSHPYIYHATDGLRPETVLELQCLQAGGGTPTCSGTGTGARRYILGPDPDERWAFLDMDGTVYAPHTDREGSTIALGAGGEAALQVSYDAYGQSLSSASATDVGPGVNSYLYRYTGQRFDPNTQLFDYKARDYSPVLGRFYQPDPAGLDQGPNLYEYVGDNPLGAGDPTGEDACAAVATQSQPASCSYGPAHGAGSRSGGAVDDARKAVLQRIAAGVQIYKQIIRTIADAPGKITSDLAYSLGDSIRNVFTGSGSLGDFANVGLAVAPGLEEGGNFAKSAFEAACGCFSAGTLVLTSDGLRPIEQIKIGDRVLSRDEITGATAYKPVVALIRPHHRQIFRLTFEVNQRGVRHRIVFSVTDDHPWRTIAGQWVQTIALTPRDQIIRAHEPSARVVDVRPTTRFETTYNLDVADFHTYFVGRDRLWVHNAWCAGTFGSVEKSIAYHFGEHGAEVGAEFSAQYVRKAEAFAQNLRGAVKVPAEGGGYRYTKMGKYIIVRNGAIVSFGAAR